MPLRQPVLSQSIIGSIVAKVIKPPLLHIRRFRVAMNVAQRVECSTFIGIGKSGTVITLLPKVPCAIKHSIEAHRRVPIEPVHNLGQILRLLRLQQIMHMVAHNAETIELELKFGLTFFERKQKQLSTFKASEPKFSIVTASCDVVAEL